MTNKNTTDSTSNLTNNAVLSVNKQDLNNSALKKASFPLMVAAAITMVSVPVSAGKYRSNNNQTYDYAKVINVEPIYETYQVNNPVQHCYDEQVSRPHNRSNLNYDSKTPEILGGIIGGAIGNRVGKRGGGKARDVATVVGAVLGGSIARDVKHNKRNNHSNRHYRQRDYYETVKRCETRDSYTTRQELVAYNVSYKYRGNIFHSQMNDAPGDRIKVKVTVAPAFL